MRLIEDLLTGSSDTALAREGSMAMQFRELETLNTQIAQRPSS